MEETIFFFGHPKAGSTWLGGLFAGLSIDLGLNFFYGQYVLPANFKKLQAEKFDVVISQNSDYLVLQNLKTPYKGVHVIRDPRDICVSSYFSYKKTHVIGDWTQLGELRSRLEKLELTDGMKEIFDFNRGFFKSMLEWNYHDPSILEVKYENLVANTDRELFNCFSFLFECVQDNYPTFTAFRLFNRIIFRHKRLYRLLKIRNEKLPFDHIQYLNQKLSFMRLARGRKTGQEDTNSHYRKGVAGDWKNHFTEDLKEEFKKQYGHLLIKLGYEKDLDW